MSIYIIRHKFSDNCYIGSTKDMEDRIKSHYKPSHYKKKKNYIISFLIMEVGIILILLKYVNVILIN